MKAKIEWYQEVLELEPSSKVFFPLARLFAEVGQYAEAVATLRQGLRRYPEHFEARLLLIECLDRLDAEDSLGTEVETLGSLLRNYPGFWKVWAENPHAGSDDAPALSRDAALALRFLAASFADGSVSWTDVIEKGLEAVLGVAGNVSSEEAASPSDTAPIEAEPEFSFISDDEAVSTEPEVGSINEEEPVQKLADVHDTLQGDAFHVEDAEDEAEDEAFSLRTLSMARVLAEQGDVREALEICEELVKTTDDTEELERIAALGESLKAGVAPVGADGEDAPAHAKDRLINTLESLAERLEARAAG